MKLKITHKTQYLYDAPVVYALQQMRLTPSSSVHQTVLNWSLQIEGGAQEAAFVDQYQNQTILVQADPDTMKIELTVQGDVETHTSDGIFGKIYGVAPLWHFKKATPLTEAGAGIKALAAGLVGTNDRLGGLHDLSNTILGAVPYGKAQTDAQTSAEDALGAQGGVCQDHAQIFISAARHAGIPARYVSGYLMMDDRVDQDASHAWAEAHIDGLGWVGFDVSNSNSPDERYVRIATGLDSHDAAPISGMRLGSGQESMIVSLQIQQ